jgi:hypothetical protein
MPLQIPTRTLIIFVLAACLSACGYREGVLVKEPVSYFWFTGDVREAVVKIDDKEPFVLTKAAALQESGEGKAYYQISPGKHRVLVEKGGQKVVDKVFYVGEGTIQEIQIP